MDYLSEAGWEDEERRYPTEMPYAQRDQGHRGADDLVSVVLSDIVDVLDEEIARLTRQKKKAEQLSFDAEQLAWDERHNWLDVQADPDGPEILQDILREAESLDDVYVMWDGDSGTVTTTIAHHWYEVEPSNVGDNG
jgi:hypothetical protein